MVLTNTADHFRVRDLTPTYRNSNSSELFSSEYNTTSSYIHNKLFHSFLHQIFILLKEKHVIIIVYWRYIVYYHATKCVISPKFIYFSHFSSFILLFFDWQRSIGTNKCIHGLESILGCKIRFSPNNIR